ncbi:hypothetical protein BV22DRAFT_527420 [Leucogyrophana mollusca]|uniref:Uncharacterized protein n=1 Tax=Leucogyrophana mollusca TaxID=85980 RepID=A0ACB8BG70_9AGAM|nr:hypothetical protein BV22DRAFT_527420 [Leucogyrophana mollusca]
MSTLPSSSSSHFKFMRSKNTLVRSSSTLALTNSSTTLAPSLSLSSQSHPYLGPSTLVSHHAATPTNTYRPTPIWPTRSNSPPDSETQAPPTAPNQNRHSATPRALRRMSRISSEQLNQRTGSSGPAESGYLAASSGFDIPEINIIGGASGDYNGSSEHRPTRSAWNAGEGSQTTGSSKGVDTKSDSPVYSYGYGSVGPTYPYLSVYNSDDALQPKAAASSSSELHECDVVSPQPRQSMTSPIFPELATSPEPLVRDDSAEEDECVPIMGGFVRRMATIESLGSREAASLSTRSTSTRRSQTPASQISSLRFATYTPSLSGSSPSRSNSLNNAYTSMTSTSGGSMTNAGRVNERGELLPDARMASPLSYSRYYYMPGNGNGHGLTTPLEEEER